MNVVATTLSILIFFQNCMFQETTQRQTSDGSLFANGINSRTPTGLTDAGRCTLTSDVNGLASFKAAIASGCKKISSLPNSDLRIDGKELLLLEADTTVIIPDNSRWFLGEGLVIQGGFFDIATKTKQVFFGAGTVRALPQETDRASCQSPEHVAYPEWFGAKINDGLDDSLAISKALQMGTHTILSEGQYDIQNRLWLKNGEYLSGQGPLKTILKQSAAFNYVRIDDKELWGQLNHSDFIVGLDSDCSKVSDLQIDSTNAPNQVQYQSKSGVQIGFTLINGVSVSTHRLWQSNHSKQIQNTELSRVRIVRPMSNCIAYFSYAGVKNSRIEQVECFARNESSGQAGLTVESFHPNPTIANAYEGISISRSIFRGGYTGIYIAGAKSIKIDDTTVYGDSGTSVPLYVFTGDSGRSTNVVISNSYFSLMEPGSRSQAVVQLIGRDIRKDRAGDHPFLRVPSDGGTSFSCYQCTFISKTYKGTEKLVPLVLDSIGVTDVVQFVKTKFIGGNYAILGQADNGDFGASVVIEDANSNIPSTVRDVNSYELYGFKLYHSDFQIKQGLFVNQALSAARLNWGTLSVYDTNFQDIGLSPAAQALPILDLGYSSPFHGRTRMSFFSNSYSAINSSAFLRVPADLDIPINYGPNAIYYPSDQSKRILESLLYGGGKRY